MREYRPMMPAAEWAAIQPLVRGIVTRAAPLVTYGERELYAAVTPLVRFARDIAMPLEDDVILAPSTIDRFTQHKLASYNRASRNTIRARLRRVSEALLGEDAAGKFRALGKAEASRPYSATDIAALRAWSAALRTRELRTSAGALLALGIGAGLTGAEIIQQRLADLEPAASSIVVSADRRRVPVDPTWLEYLEERLDAMRGSGWAFRDGQRGSNVNLITDFVSRHGSEVTLQARRMRATWLVHHLEAGTPLKRLLRIAGLQSAEALDRVLPFVVDGD